MVPNAHGNKYGEDALIVLVSEEEGTGQHHQSDLKDFSPQF